MPAIDIQSEDVMSRLLKPRADKAPGPDCIHPRMLKELAEHLATPIAMIFQQSLEKGQRSSLIQERQQTGPNYIPISLTSQLGKG